jgi:hypothetical protein
VPERFHLLELFSPGGIFLDEMETLPDLYWMRFSVVWISWNRWA